MNPRLAMEMLIAHGRIHHEPRSFSNDMLVTAAIEGTGKADLSAKELRKRICELNGRLLIDRGFIAVIPRRASRDEIASYQTNLVKQLNFCGFAISKQSVQDRVENGRLTPVKGSRDRYLARFELGPGSQHTLIALPLIGCPDALAGYAESLK